MNLVELIDSAPADPVTDPADAADVNRYCNEVAAWCNEKSLPGPVPVGDVKRHMTLLGVYTPIVIASRAADLATNPAAQAALNLTLSLDNFDTFHMDEAPVVAAVTAGLDALVAVDLLTEEQRDSVIALGDNRRSRAEANGLPPVSPAQVCAVKGF
ncbi:MAG TPA: hypothetical protein DCO82_10145 [Alphaproteobacteria bacterium]|nr:hypothetical protein [Alphaproteobacteria bacterium]